MAPRDSEQAEWTRFCEGPVAEVWIHEKCRKEMNKHLSDKDRSKIEACMKKMYCTMEHPEDISREKLNQNEGSCKLKGKDKRVQAFKYYQGRVYGVQGAVNGKRAFFAACAAVKKDDLLDPNERDRVARRIETSLGDVAGATY